VNRWTLIVLLLAVLAAISVLESECAEQPPASAVPVSS
jgi:hypothetical protein